jgi:hypothetical protein
MMLSWEIIFSLLFLSVIISFLGITAGSYSIDTILYEYQLANDFAEVVEKTGVGVSFNPEFTALLDSLTKDSGYCIKVTEVYNHSNNTENLVYNTCAAAQSNHTIVVVTRSKPGSAFKKVNYYIWKQVC